MKDNVLAVNEIFGPTFQGEGVNLGKPCIFLRLAGCNLACSWCDTRYAWDWKRHNSREELHPMTIGEVQNIILEYDTLRCNRLVITGGEPMLQSNALLKLRRWLNEWYIEIETSGSIMPVSFRWFDLFTVSIKLTNSENPVQKRIKPEVIRGFVNSGRAAFKFVVASIDDLDEVDTLVKQYNLKPVYIMPEGIAATDLENRIQLIADAVIQRGYNLTTRLQVMAYGQRRKV